MGKYNIRTQQFSEGDIEAHALNYEHKTLGDCLIIDIWALIFLVAKS